MSCLLLGASSLISLGAVAVAGDSVQINAARVFTPQEIAVVLKAGSGISGPGKPVTGDGVLGRFPVGSPVTEATRARVASGSAVKEGLLPPIKPILDVHMRDTNIILGGDGNYYLTGSTGDNIWSYNDGIELWKSPDLKTWTYLGLVWSIEKDGGWEKLWRDRHGKPVRSIWAPEIHYIHQNYYLTFGMPPGGISILKSTTGRPEGPYIHATDPNKPLLGGIGPTAVSFLIDPTLFEDDDGKVYFTYGPGEVIARMKDDLSDFAETPRRVVLSDKVDDPETRRDANSDFGFEGATVFKANGKYYFGSTDKCHGRYSMCMAISDNIYGPYRMRHETVPCNGGTNFFKAKDGFWYSSLFGDDNQAPWREKPGIIRIDFDRDGRIIVASTQPDFILNKSSAAEQRTFTPGSPALAPEAVWQYQQDIDSTKPAHDNSALLWIPPHCARIRGIIYGQQIILEDRFFTDSTIREAAADEGLALLLCCPGIDFSKPEADGPARLEDLLTKLAVQSGHPELVRAPLMPIGHSGGAIFAWYVGYQMPSRVFALLTLKSVPIQYPNWGKKWSNQSVIDGVPILCVSGQYESWDGGAAERHIRWLRGIAFAMRGYDKDILISEYVDAGSTHFGWTPQIADYCAQFIRTAAERRLPHDPPPPDQPVPLTRLPIESGWLTDFSLNSPTVYPTAPYSTYTGDKLLAFWHLTKDLALRDDAIAKTAFGKKVQMVSFVQDGKPLAPAWIQSVKFEPEADGVTVKVKAAFLDKTPDAIPPAGTPIGHGPGPILFRLIGGWCGGGEQTGPDTFRILPEALSFTKGYNSLMIMAYHPGDDLYSYAEQPCTIQFPRQNTAGNPQTISFKPLPKFMKAAEGTELALEASASSGLPVQFIVMAGPAVVRGSTLHLRDVPDHASYPIALRIRAWQWGRSIQPQVQTAPPVDQTVEIVR